MLKDANQIMIFANQYTANYGWHKITELSLYLLQCALNCISIPVRNVSNFSGGGLHVVDPAYLWHHRFSAWRFCLR